MSAAIDCSRTALFDEIKGSFKEVHRVGDALAPRRPAEVIHEAEKLAREI
jgi:hypothetical protein